MCLWIDSDTSFASIGNARSRVGGFFYLSSHPSKKPKHHDPPLNGPIFVLCIIMKIVLSSAAEAEYGGIIINAKEGLPIRTRLKELGHNQPKTGTPLNTENSTAHGIVHNNVRQNNSRCFDTGFHCIHDRAKQGQFDVYWKPGPNNKADYVTKHHPPSVHREVRPTYLYVSSYPTSSLRECINHGIPTTVKPPLTGIPLTVKPPLNRNSQISRRASALLLLH